jgi:valyl-tRNA synthetase
MPHVTEEIWSHLPARESRLIVTPWPEPDERFASDLAALERVRDAAAIARRSGVVVELEGDAKRVFDVVVQPEKLPVNGSRDDEVARLRKEVARSEGMLSNESFVANAPAEVVDGEREKLERYRRELDALGG